MFQRAQEINNKRWDVRKLSRYVVTGLISKGVGLLVLQVWVLIGGDARIGAVFAFMYGVLNAYILNSTWVFVVRRDLSMLLRALVVISLSFITHIGIFILLYEQGVHHIVASISASLLTYPLHYVLNHSWVYVTPKE